MKDRAGFWEQFWVLAAIVAIGVVAALGVIAGVLGIVKLLWP